MAEPKIAIDILVNCQTGTNALKRFNKELDNTVNGAKKVTKTTNWLSSGFAKFIATYFSIATIKNIIRVGSELQLIQKSITGLTGSAQDWEYLDKQAYKFGLSLKTVATGYKNFYSSANMAGFGKGQIQQMFSDMLLGARSIGASDQQIGGALLALEQMMSKGRVSMEELRRQLGNALPGAFEIGAKAMGVTTAQFNEMVKAGISAQEFVPKFIKTFKDQYAKGWKDVEQTVSVAQGRLTVAWEEFTMQFMHGEAGKSLAQGLNQLAELMRSPEFTRFINLLGKIFTLVMKIFQFLIRHIHLITVLLGAAGLTKVILTLGKIGVAQFTMVSKATMVLYGKLLLLLAVLGLIQDLIYGIFLPDKTDSLTEDLLRKLGIYGADKSEVETPENMSRRREEDLKRGITSNGDLYYRDSTGRLRQSKGFGFDDGKLDQAKEGMKAALGNTTMGNWLTDQAFRFGEAGARQFGKTKLFSRPTDMIPNFAPVAAQLEKTETYAPTMYYQPSITVVAPDRPSEETLRNLLEQDQKNSWRGLLNPASMNVNSWKPVGKE